MQVVRCGPATPAPVIVAASTRDGESPPKVVGGGWGMALQEERSTPPTGARSWTPYAIETAPPTATATTVAHAVEAALRTRRVRLDACFTAAAPVGSLRAMLEIDASGALTATRVGGLGDRGGEDCIARALDGLTVVMPKAEAAEIACDLARGEARPWRVAAEAGYDLIEVSRGHVRHGATTLGLAALDPEPLPSGPTYLIVADPDAEGALLELAIDWAFEGDSILVAMRAPEGPPLLVGVARTTYSTGDNFDEEGSATPTVTVTGKMMHTCVRAPGPEAPIAQPKRVEGALSALATQCRDLACDQTLGVAFDGTATARDVADVVAASRRAGFERVLIGGAPGCASHLPTIDELSR